MLLYHRPVPAKIPKRRSRAGCIHCKEKKKKCNEERPQCDRCLERGLTCRYEPIRPRRRRRTTSAIDQAQQRARSVTSDPGPQSAGGVPQRAGTVPGVAGGVRSVLADFRHDSTSSSNLEDLWDDAASHSVFGSPATSTGDTMLDRMDAFPHLDDYDRPMSVSASLALSCSTSDYSMTTSSGAPLLTPEMSQSPALPGMLPPSARTASPYPDISMVTPLVGGSPGSFSSPVLSNFHQQENRQILVDHFCDSLVQLLVFKEEPANPFRQLILPMSRRSSAVMNAIFAVSAAHMEHRGIENVEKSLDFHSRTIQGLTKLIENPKSNRDEALAVIMLLVYFEIVRSGSTLVVNSHLRGAMSIMRTRRSNNGPTSNFLEKTFRYFDVMCSLSTGGSPMSGNVPLASNRELLPVPGSPSLTMVDIVFGLVTDLWPIVHRMAHIVELKHEMENEEHNLTDRAMSLRAEFETAASTLELALHQWTPRTPGSFVSSDTPSEDSKLQSMVNNAEAYKQASLVFLFRTIRGLPRHAEKVQVHAKQALQACLRVIVFAGPMSTLLWPLFISSCEAIDEVDRDVSRSVFTHLDNRQGMQNIVHALDITHEVWRRQNEGHESHWKTVCHDMDRNIVFG